MDLQELDRLLELFYSGNSSAEEEERLIDILFSDHIPEKYAPDRSIFQVIRNGRMIPEPSENLDYRLRKRLDIEERSVIWRSRSRRLYLAVAVAASLLIAFSSYLIVRSESKVTLTLAEAEMVTQKMFTTINTVSTGFREGKSAISGISYISEAKMHLSAIPGAGTASMEALSALDYFNLSLNELIVTGDNDKDE